ncbi:hypothetical protein ACLFMI_04515 [Pseudonocardia nantongensis]|uniref:hypothetical protein n=1 Tax=Pseudonocardia nantongensis TaxID=1181885 RepID=UPI003979F531
MRISGPVVTLAAVAAVGAGVAGMNVVLTAAPEPPVVDQGTGERSLGTGYGEAPAAPAAPAAQPAPAAPAAAQGTKAFAGRTAGDEVTVQVTVENGQARAYVCNPDKGIEAWSEGPVQDGRFSLAGRDGAALEGSTDGAAWFGTATADGKSWPFAAAGTSPDNGAPDRDSDNGSGGSRGSGGSGGSGASGAGGGY